MDSRIQWAITKIMDKVHSSFYGTITLTFQNGRLQMLRTEETERPVEDGPLTPTK